jgi:hypothetical protein
MLKPFNKLEIERGYVSVSFHMHSTFYILHVLFCFRMIASTYPLEFLSNWSIVLRAGFFVIFRNFVKLTITVQHAMVKKQKSLCKLNIQTISIVCLLCVAILAIPSFP